MNHESSNVIVLSYCSQKTLAGTPPVLHSISISHYVEKVRWSMQHLHIPFEEEQDVGIFGVFFFGRFVSTFLLLNPIKSVT